MGETVGTWIGRGLLLLAVLATAAPAPAQDSLGDDLRRAAGRYAAPPENDAEKEIDSLAAEAGLAYREGRVGDAVEGYDRAAGLAYKSGAKGRAFEYALVAAELQRSRGAWRDAADRFRRLALSAVNHPRSAQAHLVACQAMAESLRKGEVTAEQLGLYDELLAEHTASWPHATSAGDVEWLRIELLAIRGDWPLLVDVMRGVSASHPRYERSTELLMTAHQRLVEQATPVEFMPRLDAATADLQPLALGPGGRWPSAWTLRQRRAALVLGRAHLVREPGGADYASRLLTAALEGTPAAEPRWRREGVVVLVVAQLVLGERSSAEQWLAVEMGAARDTVAGLLRASADRLATLPAERRREEAARLLRHLDTLSPLEASGKGGEALSKDPRARAAALAESGATDEALRLTETLLAEEPNDRALLTERARLLEASGERDESLQAWREIEARSPRNTRAWFEARVERLRLLTSLGRREEARRLLRLTALTAPRVPDAVSADRLRAMESLLSDDAGSLSP